MPKRRWGKKLHINPVYKKELKQSARMPRTAVILLVYNSLMLLFGLFAFYVTFEGGRRYASVVDYSDILSIYSIMTGIEFTQSISDVFAFLSALPFLFFFFRSLNRSMRGCPDSEEETAACRQAAV